MLYSAVCHLKKKKRCEILHTVCKFYTQYVILDTVCKFYTQCVILHTVCDFTQIV